MTKNVKSEDDSKQAQLLKIKSDALRLLSFSPRSTDELRKRLKLKKYENSLIEEVIESLKKQGFLNDEQFAKLFANSRVYSRPSGRKNLEFELRKKGLSQELVSETLCGLQDYDEKKIARDLVYTRFQKMKGLTPEKKKARIFGFLKRRGFGNDAIFTVLAELFKNSNDCGAED